MRRGFVVACAAIAACAPRVPEVARLALSSPRPPTTATSARPDVTVRGARLVPDSFEVDGRSTDPSGVARGLIDGVRFREGPGGFLETARERLEGVTRTLALPARLGGGFLFVEGDTVFRAEEWLGRARPLLKVPRGISDAFAGLDRAYLATKNGSHLAFDPTTGDPLTLGAWPADPLVGAFVALDGWHALALTDVSGAVGTVDAGQTWSKVDVPAGARAIVAVRRDPERDTWFEVAGDGFAEAFLVSDAPLHARTTGARRHCYLIGATLTVTALANCDDVRERAGRDPTGRAAKGALREAIEDGWPVGDGTALLLARGALLRVSLVDGAVVESRVADVPAAAECHAVSLAERSAPAAFGFVCGAPGGPTMLFAWQAERLQPVRTFGGPRIVATSGNGAWVVRGGCLSEVAPLRAYCIGTPGASPAVYAWREVSVEEAAEAPTTVTTTGKVARILPGRGSDEARLVFVGEGQASETWPLRFPDASESMRRFVARAVWLTDLEERRPGVLNAWLAADGTVVGVEVGAEGNARTGPLIRDLGSPFVAGRYGLGGWTRTRHTFETTDGGMTWQSFIAPAPLGASQTRACGPVGCVQDGWLRVGWGEEVLLDARPVASAPTANRAPPPFWLTCSGVAGAPAPNPGTPSPFTMRPPVSVGQASRGQLRLGLVPSLLPPPVVPRAEDLFPPPAIAPGDALVYADLQPPSDLGLHEPLGRIYAWGPAHGDWARAGRMVTRWRSPFAGRGAVVSTAVLPARFPDADGAEAALGVGRTGPVSLVVSVGVDPAHALLGVRQPGRAMELRALDEAGGELPLVRADGVPWGRVQAAARIGASWFIAVGDASNHGAVEVLRSDGGVARLLATIPRVFAEPSLVSARLATRETGIVGVVVEGEPASGEAAPSRWVVPVDTASGRMDPPEPLGAVDLSDRSSVPICDDHSATSAWTLDTAWPSANVALDLGNPEAPAYLERPFVRFRLTVDGACVERAAGAVGDEALARARVPPVDAARTRETAAPEPPGRPGGTLLVAIDLRDRSDRAGVLGTRTRSSEPFVVECTAAGAGASSVTNARHKK